MHASRPFIAAAAALFTMSAALPAFAQSGGALGPPPLTPSNRPVTSPYLDLATGNNGGFSPAYQYFRRVRPEKEFRSANQRLGSEIRTVERQMKHLESMAQSPTSALGTTGHRTSFQSFGAFFPSKGR